MKGPALVENRTRWRARSSLSTLASRRPPLRVVLPAESAAEAASERWLAWQIWKQRQRARSRLAAVSKARTRILMARGRLAARQAAYRQLARLRGQLMSEQGPERS